MKSCLHLPLLGSLEKGQAYKSLEFTKPELRLKSKLRWGLNFNPDWTPVWVSAFLHHFNPLPRYKSYSTEHLILFFFPSRKLCQPQNTSCPPENPTLSPPKDNTNISSSPPQVSDKPLRASPSTTLCSWWLECGIYQPFLTPDVPGLEVPDPMHCIGQQGFVEDFHFFPGWLPRLPGEPWLRV